MNDRASAVPPAQYLGPAELASFERQFYQPEQHHAEPAAAAARKPRAKMSMGSIRRRGERPWSASAQLQSVPYSTLQVEDHSAERQREERDGGRTQQQPEDQADQPKKPSSGFLGRVRDAFSFGKNNKAPSSAVQQEMEKRTSLQQPPTQSIPVRGSMKSQSQTHIPQLPASFSGGSGTLGGERPTRDEIMQSYNQLMASGFFQAHAIQSTRQPGPGGANTRRAAPLSPIPSPSRPSVDRSPTRRPSFSTVPHCSPSKPRPPMRLDVFAPPAVPYASPQIKPKTSRESFRYPLRGRKRGRAESDDNASDTASFTQKASTAQSGPGRRVSKKLRKTATATATTSQLTSDGVIRLVPAFNDGTVMYRKEERSVRMRSPSPATRGMTAGNKGRTGRPSSSSGPHSGQRLRKRNSSKSPARVAPPVSLHNLGRTLPESATANWERMDVDSENRDSLENHWDQQVVYTLLHDGQLGVNPEPLCVVPNANRGIPSVPRIPAHFKRDGGVWDENSEAHKAWRFGEAM